MEVEETRSIGARARKIRKQHGLSLDVVAGLAGIKKQYLSMLELGQCGFSQRGLIEDLANALGCSVADLTGQPYFPPDRATVQGRAALQGISLALNDVSPDEVPDVTPRPLGELVAWADSADEYRDQAQFALAGHDLGTLLAQLQVHALTAGSAQRGLAFTALVQSCIVASDVAYKIAGNVDLSVSAARRGYDMACRYGDPGLIGLARCCWAAHLMGLTARSHASRVLTAGINELGPSAHLRGQDTVPAEMLGITHLVQAHCAARSKRPDEANAHLAEAGKIATRIGERNGMRMHFGPTNVAVWLLGIGIELGEGGRAVESVTRMPLDVAALTLNSKERSTTLHFDLARALVQDGPHRDAESIRHLDTADRLSPTQMRNDPIARDLARILDRRARHRVRELDSLRHRFALGRQGQRSVDN